MKKQKNGIFKNYNQIWLNRDIKSTNNKKNSKLLLYHRDNSNKYNLYYPRPQKDIDSRIRKKIIISKDNLVKNSIENSFNNNNININKPFTSNLRQIMFNNMHNSTTLKNYSSKNITKDINNSINISSINKITSNVDNNFYNAPSSHRNKNQPIKIKFKMKYSNNSNTNNPSTQNLINLNSRNSEPKSSIYILDLQNETLSFEKIRSLRNLNLQITQSIEKKNTQKKIFQKKIFEKKNVVNDKIIKIKKEKKVINYNRIKNNGHDLILYRNVFYSSCPQKATNSEILGKLRKYSDDIRYRNDKKNINSKSQEKPVKKKYYFYKYKEYINKIEKEQIKAYKSDLKQKKLVNIQKIFGNKREKEKESKEKDNQLSSTKEILTNNTNNTYKLISIKNARKINMITDDNNSSSEIPMIINNYEIRKTGIRKIRRNNTMSYLEKNILIKQFKEEYFSSHSNFNSHDHSEMNLSAQVNKIKNVDLANFNLNSGEIFEKKNKIKNRLGFNKIKADNVMKLGTNETDDKKIFEILKKQYYQKRETMIKVNRRNLLAQKLLLQKISEIDDKNKSSQQNKGIPFYNLNFKYLDNDILNQKKKKIIAKYYQKNISKNQFSVRLKSRSGMSFLTNNSAFSSQMNFDPHEKEPKHAYFNLKDYLNEDIPPKDIKELDKVDIIKIENEEEDNFDMKEIEKIDSQINFNETKEEKENIFSNKINKEEKEKLKEKKLKLQFDEEKLNKMIKEEKRKKFENEYFKKYELLIKSREKKEMKQKSEKITPKELEKVTKNFLNLLKENDNIIKSIKSSKKEEDAKLFIDFKEKMNSLSKYSKKDLDLYVYRNLPIINNILDECKRDKQTENRINHFIKLLREDLDEIYAQREIILRYLKVLDYKTFSENKIYK